MTIEKVLEYTSKCIALTENIAEETNDDNEIQRSVESLEYFMNVYSLLKKLKSRMAVCDNVRTDVIEEYRKEMHATRWISCSERLPEKDGNYLCTTKGKHINLYGFSNNPYKLDEYDFEKDEKPCFYLYNSEWGYIKVDYVIAWMPLPEPYREEQKE